MTLAVLVVTQLPNWPYTKQSAVGLPPKVTSAIPTGDPVAITYPYAYFPSDQPLLWQAEDSYAFRITGGYAYHKATIRSTAPTTGQGLLSYPTANGSGVLMPNPMLPPALQTFLVLQQNELVSAPAAIVSPALVASTRAALDNYHVRLVIVDRTTTGSTAVVSLFTRVLGPPTRFFGKYSLWVDAASAGGRWRPSATTRI